MLMNTLNWSQVDNFDTGIRKTIKWYLDNPNWLEDNQTKDLKNGSITKTIVISNR